MKDSIKKFRAEAQKLEESDALKEARKKYVIILIQILIKNIKNKKKFPNQQKKKELEDEKDRSSKILKEKLDNISEKVKEVKHI
jgi:import inner membrane translocase subunit TIM44